METDSDNVPFLLMSPLTAARANRLAMERAAIREACNSGTSTSASIPELAELIQELTDTESAIIHTEAREGDIDHSDADIEKSSEPNKSTLTVSVQSPVRTTLNGVPGPGRRER